jgi:hypothetical protein
LYASPNVIKVIKSRRMKWTGHEECTGEVRCAYKILIRKPEGKRSLKRPRHIWKDNIGMDLRKVGYKVANWISLDQDRDQ